MILDRLFSILAPYECLGCGIEGAIVCGACEAGLTPAARVCFGCGVTSPRGEACERCSPTWVAGVSVGAVYEDYLREAILQMKFHRARQACEIVARTVLMSRHDWPQVDVVTCVPVSGRRLRERGYNQSEELARQVAAEIRLPYASLLARSGSAHQVGAGRAERLAQVRGAFTATESLRGARVLLIDDVVTTGATVSACAEALRLAGADLVWAAVAARH